MTTGIYQILNIANDKSYVGQSINIENRFRAHRLRLSTGNYRGNVHLQNAWNKYGGGSFLFNILEQCAPDALDVKEAQWIENCRALIEGYNKRLWPTTNRGRSLSLEHRAAISLSQKGKPETFAKCALANMASVAKVRGTKKGPLTDSQKIKQGLTLRRVLARYDFHGEKVSLAELHRRFNVYPSTIWKRMHRNNENVTDALTGILLRRSGVRIPRKLGPPSEECKAKISLALLGHPVSAATREKISATKKAAFGTRRAVS